MANNILPSEDFVTLDDHTLLIVTNHDVVNSTFDASVAADFPGVTVDEGTTFGNVSEFLKEKNHSTYNLAVLEANQLNLTYGSGKNIDDIATLFGLKRISNTATRIRVKFNGDVGTVIPAGTKVTNENETYVFVTEDSATINSDGYAFVYAYCTTRGAIEISSGYVTKLVYANDSITDVTNDVGITGKNQETDDELRTRILMQRNTGSALLESIRSGILSVDGVMSCYCEENDKDRYVPSSLSGIEPSKFCGFSRIPPDSSVQKTSPNISVYKKLYSGTLDMLSSEDGYTVAYRKQTRKTSPLPDSVAEWTSGSVFPRNSITKITDATYRTATYYSNIVEFTSDHPSVARPDSENGLVDWVVCEIDYELATYTVAYSDANDDYSLACYSWSSDELQWIEKPDVLLLRPHSIWCCVLGGASQNIASMIFRKKSSGSDMSTLYESRPEMGNYDIAVDHADTVNGISHQIKFTRPEEKLFSVNVSVIRNTFSGDDDDLRKAIKNAILLWQSGNVFGVDGLSIGQSIYSFEVGSAISEKIPEVKIERVSIVDILPEIVESVKLTAQCTEVSKGTVENRYSKNKSYPVYKDESTYYLTYDMFLDAQEWSSEKPYSKGAVVYAGSSVSRQYYKSIVDRNQGHQPSTSDDYWEDVTARRYVNNHFELVENKVKGSGDSATSTPIVQFKDLVSYDTNSIVGNFVIFNLSRDYTSWNSTKEYEIDSYVSYVDQSGEKRYIARTKNKDQKPSENPDIWAAVSGYTNAEYFLLTTALADAKQGFVITQIRDTTINTPITVSGNDVTLDMNGCTLKKENGTLFTIANSAKLTLYNNKTVTNSTYASGSRIYYAAEPLDKDTNGWLRLDNIQVTCDGTLTIYGANVKAKSIAGSGMLAVVSGVLDLQQNITTTSFKQDGGRVNCLSVTSRTAEISSGYLISSKTFQTYYNGSIFTHAPTITGGYIEGGEVFLSPKTAISGGAIINVKGVRCYMYEQTKAPVANDLGHEMYSYNWQPVGTLNCLFSNTLTMQTFKDGLYDATSKKDLTSSKSLLGYVQAVDMTECFIGCGILEGAQERVILPSSTLISSYIDGDWIRVEYYGSTPLIDDIQVYTSSNVVPDSPSNYLHTYTFEVSSSRVGEPQKYPEDNETGKSSTDILNPKYLTINSRSKDGSLILEASVRRNKYVSSYGVVIDSADIAIVANGTKNDVYTVNTGVYDKSYSLALNILPYQIGQISANEIGIQLKNE